MCLEQIIKTEPGSFRSLVDLGKEFPSGLLGLAVTYPKIGGGFIEEFEKYLDKHPET